MNVLISSANSAGSQPPIGTKSLFFLRRSLPNNPLPPF
jgi:hypothetical protein